VAKFIDWMAQKEQAKEWYTRTYAIPAHVELQKEGLAYESAGAAKAVSDGLNAFGAMVSVAAEQTPQAFRLQGSPVNTIIFNATVQYVSAVMNDELTMDEAIAKIEEEVAKNAN
jgi:alpha-1,4-digalacturonate transport system substrate-binding protein